MKTLNFATLIAAILLSVSTISYGSQKISDCSYCDAKCTESNCCKDQKNSSQGKSFACGDECTNDKCKESCSSENGSAIIESTNTKISEQSSEDSTVLTCSDKNSSGKASKDCCK